MRSATIFIIGGSKEQAAYYRDALSLSHARIESALPHGLTTETVLLVGDWRYRNLRAVTAAALKSPLGVRFIEVHEPREVRELFHGVTNGD